MYSRSRLVRENRIIFGTYYVISAADVLMQRPIIVFFWIELASKKIIVRCRAQAPARPTTQTQKRAKIK
jgi:hypothetical protein